MIFPESSEIPSLSVTNCCAAFRYLTSIASELIINTALLGSNLIVLPTSLLRLLAHFNNCFTCERLSRFKGRVYPKMKIQSSYLLIPIMMEIQVKLCCPPSISGASRQKQCCRIFSNSYSVWGFDLFTNN